MSPEFASKALHEFDEIRADFAKRRSSLVTRISSISHFSHLTGEPEQVYTVL